MKNKMQNILMSAAIVLVSVALVVCAAFAMWSNRVHGQTVFAKADHKELSSVVFDTSALEGWCGDSEVGTVRMMGAWVVSCESTAWTLCDEEGYLWIVEDVSTINVEGYYLLWLADNNTPQVEDDVIVKMWAEVH